jgi:hypothetical protein
VEVVQGHARQLEDAETVQHQAHPEPEQVGVRQVDEPADVALLQGPGVVGAAHEDDQVRLERVEVAVEAVGHLGRVLAEVDGRDRADGAAVPLRQ